MSTAAGIVDRSICDPIGLIAELVRAVEPGLSYQRVRAVVAAVTGGRAKSRRVAAALAERPGVLTDGHSPAPRGVGELLIALRQAGAVNVAPPCCVRCGKQLRCLQRRGEDWYCSVCMIQPQPCAVCGSIRRVASRDRLRRPRCKQCPDTDDGDPITVIQGVIASMGIHADPQLVADAARRCAPRPSYQQKLARALQSDPDLLTGQGHRAPVPAVLRLIDVLVDVGVVGIVPPTCPRCHRQVRVGKWLDGQRVCRTCIARSRAEQCARCGAHREPATRDEHGQPLCATCLVTDPANLETCVNCGRRRRVERRTTDGPLCHTCPPPTDAICSVCSQHRPAGHPG